MGCLFLILSSFLLLSSSSPSPPSSSDSQISKLCSTYHSGLSLQRFLFSLYQSSSHSYHPLSVNRKENLICFILLSNSSISAQIQQQLPPDHRIIFQEIPRLDRIHFQSIESLLSLFSSPKHGNDETSSSDHLFERKVSSDLRQVKILFTFGIGVMNKFHGMISEDLKLKNIRHQFLTRNPINDLTEFAQHHVQDLANHPSKLNLREVWNDALSAFHHSSLDHSSGQLCTDSQISMRILSTQQIQLSNLQNYFSSQASHEVKKSCLISLISHFLATYSLLIDIRVLFPKHTFNHWNKGIVQNNSYSEFYPYHEAGLDGSGQIIGVGKCPFACFLLIVC